MMKRRDFLKATSACVLGTAASEFPRASTAAAKARPNILIILADDMGFSDAGFMGGEAATPNLDRLAREGVLFTNCFNNAKCAPTRASLMTGLYNARVEAHRGAGNIVESDAVCIAEPFADAGYATILAGKWHIKPDPLDLGFQRHFGSLLSPVYFKPKQKEDRGGIRIEDKIYDVPDDYYSTFSYTDYAIRAIREETSETKKPFFLYLAYHAPHWPLHALPEDIAKYKGRYDAGTDAMRKARYDRMVKLGIVDPETWKLPGLEEGVPHWEDLSEKDQKRMAMKLTIHAAMVDRMDREIGRLFDFLKKTGQYDNTLIFFLADNGASPEGGMLGDGYEEKYGLTGEMGTVDSYPAPGTLGAAALNTPLRKYKTTLYEGGCRTPLVVRWPGRMKDGPRASDDLCHVFDITATCYEAAGVPYPRQYKGRRPRPLDGKSLVPALRGETLGDRTLCWQYKQARVVRNARWKLIGQVAVGGRKEKPWELYDIAADRSETENVADKCPETVRELAAQWDAWNAETGALAGYKAYVERSSAKARERKKK